MLNNTCRTAAAPTYAATYLRQWYDKTAAQPTTVALVILLAYAENNASTMPSSIDNFIPITQAANDFPTSRRTIERKRSKAQEEGDNDTLNAFMVRTKDGEEYHAPSIDLTHTLSKEGKAPETFVSVEWMEKTFRQDPRQDATSQQQDDAATRQTNVDDGGGVTQPDAPTDNPLVNALLNQLKIKDAQLETQSKLIGALTERQRESNILLSEFQKRIPATTQPEQEKTTVVDTTPKPQPVTRKPRSTTTSKKKTATAKKGTTAKPKAKKEPEKEPAVEQRSGIARFLFGSKK